jgi:hypothetical protein
MKPCYLGRGKQVTGNKSEQTCIYCYSVVTHQIKKPHKYLTYKALC